MRFILPIAALLFVALPARADDPLDCHKNDKGVLECGPVTVDGHRPSPVQVVIPRDQRARQDVDALSNDHLDDAARRK